MKMARVPTEKITTERLESWAKHLADEHATPLALVAIGHDEKSGQIVICAVEDVADADLAHLLMGAARKIHP